MSSPLSYRSLVAVTALLAFMGLTVVSVAGTAERAEQALNNVPEQAADVPVEPGGVDWPLTGSAAEQKQRVTDAGLPVLEQESFVAHYHAHLDIIVDGARVPVAAGVGIPSERGKPVGISPLHTHDRSGVLHVESPSAADEFDLAQVFRQWGVPVNTGCIGGVCNSHQGLWHLFVNGEQVLGNDPLVLLPSLVLADEQQIVLVFGEVPKPLPTYEFQRPAETDPPDTTYV